MTLLSSMFVYSVIGVHVGKKTEKYFTYYENSSERGGRGGFFAEKEVGKWIEDALPL